MPSSAPLFEIVGGEPSDAAIESLAAFLLDLVEREGGPPSLDLAPGPQRSEAAIEELDDLDSEEQLVQPEEQKK